MDFELKTLNRARLCTEKCDALVVLVPQDMASGNDALSSLIAAATRAGDFEAKPVAELNDRPQNALSRRILQCAPDQRLIDLQFVDRQLPGMKRVREDPCVPFGYMLTECSPCVQVRVMFDFVATACRRLATAPAKIRVLYKTTVRWEGRIMELVKRGRVRKVQVWLQRFARLCVVTILLILGCHCLLTL